MIHHKSDSFNRRLADFKKAFGNLLPQPVVAQNHHIGVVCSVLPLIGNMLLVTDEYLDSQQPIMQIPEGYDYDIFLRERACEAYSLELLPDLSNTSYSDFIIDVEITLKTHFADELIAHFKEALACLSKAHCFAWHILSSSGIEPFFRQIIAVHRPDRLTFPDAAEVPGQMETDQVVFSLREMSTIDPESEKPEPLKSIMDRFHTETIEAAIYETCNTRYYWPSDATPEALKCNVRDFFNQINPFCSEVIFEDNHHYSFVCTEN